MKPDIANIQKILFIIHLAIGDYTYMQRCFVKLKKQYPHLRIDLLVQDHRATDNHQKWKHLENYILYEWLESSHLFGKIYKTYSSCRLQKAIEEAKEENYPLVISLGDLRSQNYSALAREIAQHNYAMGIDIHTTIFHQKHRQLLNLLDERILDLDDKSHHISQKFAHWFSQIAPLTYSKTDLYPQIEIPQKWDDRTRKRLKSWGYYSTKTPIIFINIYAKGEERCWKESQALELIIKLQTLPHFHRALFILNAPPEHIAQLQTALSKHSISNTFTFCASESFFELPALLTYCQLIITVDTSIMHLACISDAFLISLIRKKETNDIRWTPLKADNNLTIYTQRKRDSISDISVEKVFAAIKSHYDI